MKLLTNNPLADIGVLPQINYKSGYTLPGYVRRSKSTTPLHLSENPKFIAYPRAKLTDYLVSGCLVQYRQMVTSFSLMKLIESHAVYNAKQRVEIYRGGRVDTNYVFINLALTSDDQYLNKPECIYKAYKEDIYPKFIRGDEMTNAYDLTYGLHKLALNANALSGDKVITLRGCSFLLVPDDLSDRIVEIEATGLNLYNYYHQLPVSGLLKDEQTPFYSM